MRLLLILAAVAGPLAAQTANPIPPQAKSQKEVEAIKACLGAADTDSRITACKDLITSFADTEYKAQALYFIASSYQQKGDTDNMIVYAEQTLEADPKFFGAMLQIAQGLATRTRKYDLDKEEKLSRAEKLCKQAIELIDGWAKPNPRLTDEQFAGAKKEFTYQAHDTLGVAAAAREKFDVAVTEYNTALGLGIPPDPATLVRLGTALTSLKKYDEAIAAFDKALNDPSAVPVVKKVAMSEKMKAVQARAGETKKQ